MPLTSITPGRVTGLWVAIYHLKRTMPIDYHNFLKLLKNLPIRGGGLPLDDSVKLALSCDLLKEENGRVTLSVSGATLVNKWDNEEPSDEIIREILLIIIKKNKPSWIVFSDSPIDERFSAIPQGWRESIQNLGLFNQNDELANEWWLKVSAINYEIMRDIRKRNGDLGEQLTIQYEKNRLLNEGLQHLPKKIIWTSKIDDLAGYDVKSFMGDYSQSERENELLIEVKSSNLMNPNTFVFYLSRGEWNMALKNPEKYYFYLWSGINYRYDFDYYDGKTPIIVPYLGAMKLHGIRAESGDEYAPEELASYLKSIVVASPNQARVVECLDTIDIPMLDEEEKNIIRNYLDIRQFEIVLREYIISSLENTYGNNLENRLENLLEADFNKSRERVQAIYSRYGQEVPLLSIRDLFDYAGFDLYVKLFDNDKLWTRCFQDSLKDRHQAIEGLTIIRDFRNEVAHFRKSIHPKLADAAGMYRSVLEGKIRMCDPKFRELVEMVPRPKTN